MTIIVFLIDTSASMNQRAYYNGYPTILDVSKQTVETLIKVRQRSPESRGDRYILLTYDEPPHHIKSGWKENLPTFYEELKKIKAFGLTSTGHALQNTFDFLNLNRIQSGIDTYGQGRCPFFLQPTFIVVITDGLSQEVKLPKSVIPGGELTEEPYRWDQRIFAFELRFGATPEFEVTETSSSLTSLCNETAGRVYTIQSQGSLTQSIDNFLQKIQSGVLVTLQKSDNLSTKQLLLVPKPKGSWPIPEDFIITPDLKELPSRTSHPIIRFEKIIREPKIPSRLPYDTYELGPSLITEYILNLKEPGVCWNVLKLDYPVGFVKAKSNSVQLIILPFNYPVLLPLLEVFVNEYSGYYMSQQWIERIQKYLSTVPTYYYNHLRRSLSKMGISTTKLQLIIPESLEIPLNLTITNYLKTIKNLAKIEFDQQCNLQQSPQQSLTQNSSYLNPFLNPRSILLDQLLRMRANYLRLQPKLFHEDILHSIPIAQMGNYQEYPKKIDLRQLEEKPLREHMFGNPFKRILVDEADVDLDRIPTEIINRPKRKPGPLPKDFRISKPRPNMTTEGIKRELFLEVKRPGRNYNRFLEHLEQIRGDLEVQENLMAVVYHECLRFKRNNLAEKLLEFWRVRRDNILENK